MFGLLQFLLVAFVLLSAVYVVVSIWSRRTRRAKLIAAWHEDGRPGTQEDYVDTGLEDYDSSFRRKLILLVYIVPALVVITILYLTNFH